MAPNLREIVNDNRNDAEVLSSILDRMLAEVKEQTNASLDLLLKHMRNGFKGEDYERDAMVETAKLEAIARILKAGIGE